MAATETTLPLYHLSAIATSPADTLTMPESAAPWSAREQAMTFTGRIPYTEGLTPVHRAELPGYNSGVMALLLGLFLLIAINFRHYTTFLKTFTQNLFSVRKRPNVFDERSTTNETRILVSLILLVCVSEGILMFSCMRHEGYMLRTMPYVLIFTAVAAIYYIFQLIAYRTVGFVFTSTNRALMWMKGFNASQSLLGITLIGPAVISLFYPSASGLLIGIGIFLYAIARIIFICKGFRIFYNNSFALIYFILYLCTLEIIPLIIIYKTSILCSSII
ncbi:MAG: DUF4271 domain-containing protein [Bacteroides sp.]|nr:DUF4271 domain-containing protein [Bacteroides sp.]MCM1413830.1 DUF4271 domain-containing protein [Bacteroides sp.]MCM1471226.1 DUF4271 domain-containing protein [Bacteroides sp.]